MPCTRGGGRLAAACCAAPRPAAAGGEEVSLQRADRYRGRYATPSPIAAPRLQMAAPAAAPAAAAGGKLQRRQRQLSADFLEEADSDYEGSSRRQRQGRQRQRSDEFVWR